jgi:hypothetical protein
MTVIAARIALLQPRAVPHLGASGARTSARAVVQLHCVQAAGRALPIVSDTAK